MKFRFRGETTDSALIYSCTYNPPPPPPPPSGWIDITNPSFWMSPLNPNIAWDGSEWTITTTGMSSSTDYLIPTEYTRTNFFATATKFRINGYSPNVITLYYYKNIGIGDALAYLDAPPTLIDYERNIVSNVMNDKANWTGFVPAGRYNGDIATVTKIEIYVP